MSNDWWSRKISGDTPAPAPSTPPVTPPMRSAIRIPQPLQPVAVNPTVQLQPQGRVLDPNRGAQENVTMGEAIRLWKGGEAARRETQSCPECGSHLVFSRSKGMVNGASPAPRCYECGWNGRYAQGDQSNWV